MQSGIRVRDAPGSGSPLCKFEDELQHVSGGVFSSYRGTRYYQHVTHDIAAQPFPIAADRFAKTISWVKLSPDLVDEDTFDALMAVQHISSMADGAWLPSAVTEELRGIASAFPKSDYRTRYLIMRNDVAKRLWKHHHDAPDAIFFLVFPCGGAQFEGCLDPRLDSELSTSVELAEHMPMTKLLRLSRSMASDPDEEAARDRKHDRRRRRKGQKKGATKKSKMNAGAAADLAVRALRRHPDTTDEPFCVEYINTPYLMNEWINAQAEKHALQNMMLLATKGDLGDRVGNMLFSVAAYTKRANEAMGLATSDDDWVVGVVVDVQVCIKPANKVVDAVETTCRRALQHLRGDDESKECWMCLETIPFQHDSVMRNPFNCGHVVCEDCVSDTLALSSCGVCRRERKHYRQQTRAHDLD